MFTGIIEALGEVIEIKKEGTNIHFTIQSNLSKGLKIDQSLAHNGVCLTVVAQDEKAHRVTVINETIKKTNLGSWVVGSKVNLERCMQINDRLNGHMVQGHVDQIADCIKIEEKGGSWEYCFKYDAQYGNITVEKGSVCVNGISLTVVNSQVGQFSVFVIPYTYQNTNMHNLKAGDTVNLEFDIIGKYVAKLINKP